MVVIYKLINFYKDPKTQNLWHTKSPKIVLKKLVNLLTIIANMLNLWTTNYESFIFFLPVNNILIKVIASKNFFQKKVFKADQVGQVNPPKFDCSDDMSSLTYLNDACVLWNSVVRYKNELIYTYSGLFCIAINPYKRFPIYTQRTMDIYISKRR